MHFDLTPAVEDHLYRYITDQAWSRKRLNWMVQPVSLLSDTEPYYTTC
jgi:hypothetical protein